jgi:hypothetical protein
MAGEQSGTLQGTIEVERTSSLGLVTWVPSNFDDLRESGAVPWAADRKVAGEFLERGGYNRTGLFYRFFLALR